MNQKGIPTIQWDANGQPTSTEFGDVYFSRDNGLEESRYVFLQHNRIVERFQQLPGHNTPLLQRKTAFTICETGFGTGLNFLLTKQAWEQNNSANNHILQFISVEKFPLNKTDLKKALALWPELHQLAEELLERYPPHPAPGFHRIHFPESNLSLTLFFGEAQEGIHELENAVGENCVGTHPWFVDAWYLDGFAPAKNPQMWTPELFQAMASVSNNSTTFATFTAAGAVKRGLIDAGFECAKVPGYGRKREMLCGTFTGNYNNSETGPLPETHTLNSPSRDTNICNTNTCNNKLFNTNNPDNTNSISNTNSTNSTKQALKNNWRLGHKTASAQTIAIIGGGIAGCLTAHALAARGKNVVIYEKNSALANEASGNLQGAVYTKLSPHPGVLNQFNISAQIYANHFYHVHNVFNTCGDRCGVLHLAQTQKSIEHYQALDNKYRDSLFAYWVNPEEIPDIAGVDSPFGGLFVPDAGWLHPAKVCDTLTCHPLIKIQLNTNIHSLKHSGNWQLIDTQNNIVGEAPTVIFTNAFNITQIFSDHHFQLKVIRGQVTHLPKNAQLKNKTVICGDGYLAPPQKNHQCLGATFNLNDTNDTVRESDHQTNLDNLRAMVNYNTNPPLDSLCGRVGFRCTTPDYLPITGPIPNLEQFIARFQSWRSNATVAIEKPGVFHKGLFANLGFGSRGLAYAPLCAELLASQICPGPMPVSQELSKHLHPARFIVRDLKRNRL